MKLYAVAEPNNSIAKSLAVYDKDGLAHIVKTMPNGKIIAWDAKLTAAAWVEYNSSPRQKWAWTMR